MSSTQNIDDVDGEVSSHCIATLRFPDDFAEFKARADSGGSTYGILKRHAFAQQSLRVVPPSDPEVNVVVPQRRANSLVPPSSSSPDPEASGDTADAADQKMLIAVLCDQSSQQRRQRYHHNQHLKHQRSNQHHRQQSEQSAVKMDTLQLPTDLHCARRHSDFSGSSKSNDSTVSVPRRRSLQPTAPSSAAGADPASQHAPVDASQLGCRRRSFSVTPKGDVVNEGDEILHQQDAHSTSAAKWRSGTVADEGLVENMATDNDDEVYRVLVLGGPDVGKTAITQQFLTSEYMAAQNTSFDDGQEIKVPVLLNGTESVMEFIDLPYTGEADMWRQYSVDGYIVVYSITDRRSFQKACDVIASIRQQAKGSSKAVNKPLLLAANKSDLERARIVAKEEGKSLAKSYGSKYIELSAILNHKVDDLLVSTLKQIRLCSGGGRRPRAGENSAEDGLLSSGDGGRPTDSDDCSADSPSTRSRSPGLFSRLIRAASPRLTQ